MARKIQWHDQIAATTNVCSEVSCRETRGSLRRLGEQLGGEHALTTFTGRPVHIVKLSMTYHRETRACRDSHLAKGWTLRAVFAP